MPKSIELNTGSQNSSGKKRGREGDNTGNDEKRRKTAGDSNGNGNLNPLSSEI
jgi:hypothetical protein